MANDPQVAQQQPPAPVVQSSEQSADHGGGDRTTFTSAGAKPAVGGAPGGSSGSAAPSASDQGYAQHAPSEHETTAARNALAVAEDILVSGLDRGIAGAPHEYQPALHKLYTAINGKGPTGEISGPDRVTMFKHARAGLGHAITIYAAPTTQGWLQTHILSKLDAQQQSLSYVEAKYRVDHSLLEGRAVKEGVEGGAEAAELNEQVTKLHKTLMNYNEQVIRMSHHAIEEEVEELAKLVGEGDTAEEKVEEKGAEKAAAPKAAPKAKTEGGHEGGAKHGGGEGGEHGAKTNGVSALLELQNAFMLFSGWTKLNDKEFQAELHDIHGFFPGVSSISELLKAIAEFTAGSMGTICSGVAMLAKVMKEPELVAQALALSRHIGHYGSTVVAGIEVIHGISVLLDSKASAGDKTDAFVDVASGTAWLGSYAAETWGGAAMEGATAMGAGLSIGITVAYEEFKYSMQLYGDAKLGISKAYMDQAFATIEGKGSEISRDGQALTRCQVLLSAEKDPKRRAALKKLETDLAANLGVTVDQFIESCDPKGYAPGVAQFPGAYKILREAFDGLGPSRNARTPQAAVVAATATLKKISWALGHAALLIKGNAMNQRIGEVQAEAEKQKAKKAGGEGEKKGEPEHHA